MVYRAFHFLNPYRTFHFLKTDFGMCGFYSIFNMSFRGPFNNISEENPNLMGSGQDQT